MSEAINNILQFWFGTEVDQKKLIAQQSGIWWGKSDDIDTIIKNKFGQIYQLAINDGLSEWLQTAKGQLALIIVLDQFSRVINRNSSNAFSQDSKALKITLDGISLNIDKSLSVVERVFFYMPLEHAEDIELQNQCVGLFQQLLFDVPEELKNEFQNFLEFAKKHQLIIERFNRFPHRNAVLNRSSSAEEIAFLTEPNSSF